MRTAYIPLIILPIWLGSCLGTARISDLPKTADEINFDAYSKKPMKKSGGIWTFKTTTEYYLEIPAALSQDSLMDILIEALRTRKYARIDPPAYEGSRITATHGATMNEWAYVTGIYYRLSPGKVQLYIRTKITQDITGGAKNNLSEKLGEVIASLIGKLAPHNS